MQTLSSPNVREMFDDRYVMKPGDALSLLRLVSRLCGLHPRFAGWRGELVHSLTELLASDAAVIISLTDIPGKPLMTWGFGEHVRGEEQESAVTRELDIAAFLGVVHKLYPPQSFFRDQPTITVLLDKAPWQLQPWEIVRPGAVLKAVPGAHGIISLRRDVDRNRNHIIVVWQSRNAALRLSECERPYFSFRDRLLLDILHQAIETPYREEIEGDSDSWIHGLPPRLKQTLECLMTERTERQIAAHMSLSIHTVHDYVKALYRRFGVSSRRELLAKRSQRLNPVEPISK